MKHSEAAAGAAHAPDGHGTTHLPAILLVEDDPTTLAYLQAMSEGLPVRVEAATCLADALRLAGANEFALLLVDANLPDGTGADLLRQLRARGVAATAVAHTAAGEASAHAALRAAGFADVLVKPIAPGAWREAIARHLPCEDEPASPTPSLEARPHTLALWDDDAAAAALGGHRTHVDGLRHLFLAELPAQLAVLQSGDADACAGQLHRLRASCAFVGAARLDAAVRRLHDAPHCAERLRHVLDAAEATMASRPTA